MKATLGNELGEKAGSLSINFLVTTITLECACNELLDDGEKPTKKNITAAIKQALFRIGSSYVGSHLAGNVMREEAKTICQKLFPDFYN